MARILVVDDAPFARAVACKHLSSAGFETVQAGDGQEGLVALEGGGIDAVVTDLLMPNMDGVEFIEALRSQGLGVSVVVLSADIRESTLEACEAMGCRHFLHKPVKRETLLEAVRLAVAQQEAV